MVFVLSFILPVVGIHLLKFDQNLSIDLNRAYIILHDRHGDSYIAIQNKLVRVGDIITVI